MCLLHTWFKWRGNVWFWKTYFLGQFLVLNQALHVLFQEILSDNFHLIVLFPSDLVFLPCIFTVCCRAEKRIHRLFILSILSYFKSLIIPLFLHLFEQFNLLYRAQSYNRPEISLEGTELERTNQTKGKVYQNIKKTFGHNKWHSKSI